MAIWDFTLAHASENFCLATMSQTNVAGGMTLSKSVQIIIVPELCSSKAFVKVSGAQLINSHL